MILQTQEAMLFQLALGIQSPWKVTEIELDTSANKLDIYIDFERGATFQCPKCQTSCKAYDTRERAWRHMDFFQYKTRLHARVPRIRCKEHGTLTVPVPWARPGSGFTLLFEAILILLCKESTVKGVERIVKERDKRIWNVLDHYVQKAVEKIDCSNVTSIGLDETSSKKGHKYVTLAVDMEERKVFHVTEGKCASTVKSIAQSLKEHNGNPFNIGEISLDMSPAFIKGCKDNFPGASLTFDKFHIMKIINEAVDNVRKEESRYQKNLKGSKYIWLRRPDTLSENQKVRLDELLKDQYSKTAKAYALKLSFVDFWECNPSTAESYLFEWVLKAQQSNLPPMISAADMILRHWEGIIRWFKSHINNGVLEGINSSIQAVKRKARGFRTIENFITMIYLIAGKIDLDPILHLLPT